MGTFGGKVLTGPVSGDIYHVGLINQTGVIYTYIAYVLIFKLFAYAYSLLALCINIIYNC